MRCPFCGFLEDKVVDSRLVREGRVIRRRRECEGCIKRFTTYETIEEGAPVIVKKDGRREAYDRQKLIGGIVRACEKRPVSMTTINEWVDRLESRLFEGGSAEVPSSEVGEAVVAFLKTSDPVAYVRFASVYHSFSDLDQFVREIREMTAKK